METEVPSLIAEIEKTSSGASFCRADLHIHSFGPQGSYDVLDERMTPENIVDAAIREQLHVIRITDHNQIANVDRALKHVVSKPLLVIPGVELSTPRDTCFYTYPIFDHYKIVLES